ncbi:uncharacterized protein LOC130736721 [Lotus japonicus]|uniref:uncharacterized protein LOC130736721 n=1 Tax=Lotus japonicus TaxID=34305 RepID=UPI00258366BD|nr:uncharacterized protein LOC130736721 [Lotus japonicus]
MAALACFLPIAGDKAASFFTCLKKNSTFQWTEACEQAFTELKKSLATLPVLSKPTPGVPLMLYLAVTDRAVSTVLLQEGKKHKVIYFVSHTLQGVELRYQKIEKAALGDWSVELSEYDIQYEPRGQITIQNLIDFVAELTPTEGEKTQGEWVLSVDGSSNDTGSGAGITIESPDKMVIEQSLKFEFKASNNQSEYEALIAGLRLAIELCVQKLFIKGDSQLVVKQVKGENQVKDPQLSKYLEVVHRLMMEIEKIRIEHIPRSQNERANVLVKLASTGRLGNHQTVIQETLPRPNIDLVEVKLKAVKAVTEGEPSWMESIKTFLQNLPKDDNFNTKEKRREASFYTLVGDELYRRGNMSPMLKCVDVGDAQGIMAEVHERVCSSHIGGRSLAVKVLRAGFYWPTIKKDCLEYVKKCEKCQVFYLGIEICADLGIEMRFASVEHPQTNGQAESANKVILKGLKKKLYEAKVEIENRSWRVARFNEDDNGENLIANLIMLPEEQREAHLRNEAEKVKFARKFATKVVPRTMRVGDLVLRKKTIPDKHNKLSPNWGGPYRIICDVGGGAYKLEQLNG